MKTKDFRLIQGMLVADANNQGGSGGTSNYNDLSNKPKIDNVVLEGNKTAEALGLTSLDVFTEETQTISTHLQDFKNYVDSVFSKQDNRIEFYLAENVKVEMLNASTYINILGEGKTINFPQGIKVSGSDVAIKNQLVANIVNGTTTDIKIGSDLLNSKLLISEEGDNTIHIKPNINGLSLDVNNLDIYNNEDEDIVNITSKGSELRFSNLTVVLNNGINTVSLNVDNDGNLLVNGKKVLTE